MSESLKKCKVIPGWCKVFLHSIKLGYSEQNSANLAGISTTMVRRRAENDPDFYEAYKTSYENRKQRPVSGGW